jgi:hypothetical protein
LFVVKINIGFALIREVAIAGSISSSLKGRESIRKSSFPIGFLEDCSNVMKWDIGEISYFHNTKDGDIVSV